jgi:hypothetical protein
MDTTTFSTIAALLEVIRHLQLSTQADRKTRRLQVCGLKPNDLAALDKAAAEGSVGHFRVEFDADCERLQLKMPSIRHEVTHRAFERIFFDVLSAQGISWYSLCPIGSGRLQSLGQPSRSKEADSALKPSALRHHASDPPTFVIECGVSESMQMLRQDTVWWLTEMIGQTNVVVTLRWDGDRLEVELWRLAGTRNVGTRRTPATTRVPICTQRVVVDPSNTSSNADLRFSYQEIFLRPAPEQSMAQLTITSRDLSALRDHVLACTT